MGNMIKMVVVLTLLSSFSGGLLAAIRDKTKDRIENQQLQFVKGPAILDILKDAGNDPVADRFKLTVGEEEKSIFVGVYDGKATAIALETSASGYGGPVGLMVGIDTTTDKILGVGVTTHSETPGLGARAKTDKAFTGQFAGVSALEPIQVLGDGGSINAIGGATITSRAVTAAAARAGEIYAANKDQLIAEAKKIK